MQPDRIFLAFPSWNLQFHDDMAKQLRAAALSVENESSTCLSAISQKYVEQERCLAGSGLRNQRCKANLVLNSKNQRGQCFAMLDTGVKEARVGRYPKGQFPQAIEFQHFRHD